MPTDLLPALRPACAPWIKGRIIGQKLALLLRHVWSIRVRLKMAGNPRDLSLFNMAIDSKLRGYDLVSLRVRHVFVAGRVKERASMIQSKTGKPVGFEIAETTRLSLERWIRDPEMIGPEFLCPGRTHGSPHLSMRQYARIVRGWVKSLGLEPGDCGTWPAPEPLGQGVADRTRPTGNFPPGIDARPLPRAPLAQSRKKRPKNGTSDQLSRPAWPCGFPWPAQEPHRVDRDRLRRRRAPPHGVASRRRLTRRRRAFGCAAGRRQRDAGGSSTL